MPSALERDRGPGQYGSDADGLSYEGRLAADPRWALVEGSKHFEARSGVSQALRKLAVRPPPV